MLDPIEVVVIPFVLSAGVTVAVLLLAWVPWVRARAGGDWVAPIALAAGVLAPFRWITGAIPAFPPTAAMGCIFYLTLLSALVAVLLELLQPPRWAQLVVVIGILAAGFAFVFWNQLRDPETLATVVRIVLVASLVGGIWWWAMETSAQEMERVTAPLAMLVLALFGSALLIMSASLTYGRLGFAFAGAALPLFVLGFFRSESLARGCGLVLAASLGGILLAGNYYSASELRWANLALVGSAPLVMAARRLIPAARREGKAGSFVALSLLILPLMIALVITVPRFIQEMQTDVSGYDY